MTKSEAFEMFLALCKDPRTRFDEHGVGMAGPDHKHRRVTIRTDVGDEATMSLVNYPGGFALDAHTLTEDEYRPMRAEYDFGSGLRSEARWEDVRKMLGLS